MFTLARHVDPAPAIVTRHRFSQSPHCFHLVSPARDYRLPGMCTVCRRFRSALAIVTWLNSIPSEMDPHPDPPPLYPLLYSTGAVSGTGPSIGRLLTIDIKCTCQIEMGADWTIRTSGSKRSVPRGYCRATLRSSHEAFSSTAAFKRPLTGQHSSM
jgi:hypothetical protein